MSQPWTALFQFNRMPLMELNLQGISQELADSAPAEGVNSVAWVLNHVVNSRIWMLGTVLKSEYTPSIPQPKSLAEFVAAVDETQAAIGKAFEGVHDWNDPQIHPVTQATMPLEQIVGTFFMHEAYHLGQLGVARKLLGLPGALKNPTEKAMA
ncbi:MAG TPA: DinB family protein [Holophagaceae bacterium]|jgi:uncharacterized damage-inducible protein DinB|nr:DinB family protein [Holophagaceae bacterium]